MYKSEREPSFIIFFFTNLFIYGKIFIRKDEKSNL